jgi:hypothetical protein
LRKCADPRDRIYGILSLVPPCISNIIRPQYSLPVVDVFKDTFLAHVILTQRLELLRTCNKSDQLAGSPSWVPNCCKPNKGINLTYIRSCAGSVSSSQAHYQMPDTLEVISVPLLIVSTVNESSSDPINDAFRCLRILGIDRLQSLAYPTGENLLDAYAWSLALGTLREQMPDHRGYPTLEDFRRALIQQGSVYRGPGTADLILECFHGIFHFGF